MILLIKLLSIVDRQRVFSFAGFILSAFFLAGCGASALDWVENPPRDYPTKRYLTALGSGKTPQEADNRALSGMAQIFEARIESQSTDFNFIEGERKDSFIVKESIQRASQSVAVFSQKTIEGIIIGKRGEDDGRYYSLAVLERAPAALRMQSRIEAFDRETADFLARAGRQSRATRKIALLSQALDLQDQRRIAHLFWNILTEQTNQPAHPPESIRKAIRDSFAGVKVTVEAEDPSVRRALTSAVSGLGIQIDPKGDKITALLDTDPIFSQDSWYWLRGALELRIQEGGIVTAKKRKELKLSAQRESQLDKRLETFLEKEMALLLFQAFTKQK